MTFLPTCLLLTVPELFILMDYLLVSGTYLLKDISRASMCLLLILPEVD